MARKVTALALGLLLAQIPRMILGGVFGQIQDIVAELSPGLYPYLLEAMPTLDLLAFYAAAFVTGFAFWAGTAESWRSSGAWAASGAILLLAFGGGFEHALFLGLAIAANAVGAFHGARWGDAHEDDPRVEGVQGFIFKVNPFALK